MNLQEMCKTLITLIELTIMNPFSPRDEMQGHQIPTYIHSMKLSDQEANNCIENVKATTNLAT